MDKVSMSVKGNFFRGTVNCEDNEALYDDQMNQAQISNKTDANLCD